MNCFNPTSYGGMESSPPPILFKKFMNEKFIKKNEILIMFFFKRPVIKSRLFSYFFSFYIFEDMTLRISTEETMENAIIKA